MKLSLYVVCYLIAASLLGTQRVEAGFGGGVCAIPGTVPGAAEKCTSKENGFCAIDKVDFANNKADGKCICYRGYTGDMCQTKDPSVSGTTTSTSSSSSSVLTAAALAGLGALLLSQNSAAGGYGGVGSPYAQQNLYNRQPLYG